MTQTLATDSNNDIYIGARKDLQILTGIDAVAAACRTACLAQLGEMVLATKSGIPTFQTIWIGNPNFALFENAIRTTLLGVDGVQGVSSIKIRQSGDTMTYTANITTNYGATTING